MRNHARNGTGASPASSRQNLIERLHFRRFLEQGMNTQSTGRMDDRYFASLRNRVFEMQSMRPILQPLMDTASRHTMP